MKVYYKSKNVTLYHDDCMDALPVLRERESKIGLVLTDPPFGIGYQNNYTSRKHQVLVNDSKHFDYTPFSKECFQLLKEDSAMYAFSRWSHYPLNFQEIASSSFKMKETLICQKRPTGVSDLYGAWQTNCDWVIFAHKGRFKFRHTELVKNKRPGVLARPDRKKVTSLFKERMPSCWFGPEYPYSSETSAYQKSRRVYHPTIKSVEFCRWLILLSSDPKDIVLDPFAGTGTTLVAALVSGRKAIGIEIDEKHCRTAARRLENETGIFDSCK